MKQLSKVIAAAFTAALLITAFAVVEPVSAADIPDMEKANVSWDLQNNKTLKYKQYWYTLGIKQHTVKMTNYQVKDADTPGYKQCSFKLTFKVKAKPNKKQVAKMANRNATGRYFTEYGYCIVDYQTGYDLSEDNEQGVTADGKWKFSKRIKHKGKHGSWISYPRQAIATIKITYPETYTDLAIGAVGCSKKNLSTAEDHWDGLIPFSEATALYSKKDASFAHFMRVE